MTRISKIIAVAAIGASMFGTGALADTAPPAPDLKDPARAPLTTGSIDVEPTFAQRIRECMAIWEPATHMTKEQWLRSCRTTLQSLSTD